LAEQPADMVTLTINGRSVDAPKGTMLVDAAKAAGIEIPIFCYEPRLGPPVGACRMCLVEVEGMRGLQTACSTPVAPDMVVNTDNEVAKDAQDGVLELLLANHPLDCPVCDKGGECPLQDRTFRFGPGETRTLEPKVHFPKPLELSPLVALDRERCIACYRCVRFSQDVAEDAQLTFQERGDHTEIATFSGDPYEGRFTGNTIDLCPVGALTSSPYRFVSRPWDIKNTPSVCAGCSMGCNVEITERDNEVKRVTGRPDPNMAVEEGWICDRGRWGYPALRSADRIDSAVLVDSVGRRKVLLERAVAEAAGVLVNRDARVGILLGDPITVETGFLALELAQRVGAGPAMVARMGIPGTGLGPMRSLPGAQMDDIDQADVVLVIGGDPCTQQPVAELRVRKARRRGARVAVFGPRPSALDDSCEAMRTVPGHLMDAAGAIRDRLDGSQRAVVLWDEADLAAEPDAAALIAALVQATPGAQAIEMCADTSGPGLRALGIGTDADLLAATEAGEIDVIVTIAADPITGPSGDRWAQALVGVGTIVEMASHATAITGHADLVLPLLTPLEEEGVLVSMTGRAQRLRPGAREVPGAAAAWEILIGLTHRLGKPVPDRTPAQAFSRLAREHAPFAGLDYEVLGRDGAVIATPAQHGPDSARRDPQGEGLLVIACTPVFGDATAHRSDALASVVEPTRVGLSPAEADRLGVRTEARVRVATPHGEAVLPLEVDARLHEGAAYLYVGDPAQRAMRLLPLDRGPVRAVVGVAAREEVSA
jgi:NADH-quinone oxidoreductase subunit G